MLKARWSILEMQENIHSVQVNKINWHVPFPLTPGGDHKWIAGQFLRMLPSRSVGFVSKYPCTSLSFEKNVFLYLEKWPGLTKSTYTKSKITWALLLQRKIGAWNHHILKTSFPCGQGTTSWRNLVVAKCTEHPQNLQGYHGKLQHNKMLFLLDTWRPGAFSSVSQFPTHLLF